MKAPFIRSAYNYDTKQASDDTGLLCEDPSLTIQSQAEDADINVIVKRFGITGQLPDNVRIPQYGDFTGITDYASAWRAVHDAQQNFMQIPADVRARFQNDPQAFLAFAADPANIDTLREMGLAKALPAPQAPNTPPATPRAPENTGGTNS